MFYFKAFEFNAANNIIFGCVPQFSHHWPFWWTFCDNLGGCLQTLHRRQLHIECPYLNFILVILCIQDGVDWVLEGIKRSPSRGISIYSESIAELLGWIAVFVERVEMVVNSLHFLLMINNYVIIILGRYIEKNATQ